MRSHALLASLVLPLAALAACGGSGSGTSSASSSASGSGGHGGGVADGGGGAGGKLDPKCTLPADDLPAPKVHTPRWAFEPWISKDISTGADTYDFVGGFQSRDIPIGAVVLDSPWETNYNTLQPNPNRYPDFAKMVSDMHDKGVKVVLWITQFVNVTAYDLETGGDTYDGPSPNYQDGLDCNYYVDEAYAYSWWKGTGSAVDFLNESAKTWWHRQQDTVLTAGIDGWKLDFGDEYVSSDPVQTAKGPVPHQEYSEAYYHDYYAYGVAKRGKDFVTMVRAYDTSYGFAGRFYAKKEDAPVCWMGDNRRDWVGIADVLDEELRSAQAGYAVLGSDVGGYLDRDDLDLTGPQIPLDPVVFARWTALGGLSPLMQLHGRANLTPWTFPTMADEVTANYRYWAKLHHELVPFYYSLSEETYAGGPTPIVPQGDPSSWAGDYRYMLGNAFLVAPLLDATGKRDVKLPAGTWYDWWDPTGAPIAGGKTLAAYDSTDFTHYPLFIHGGAIVPMVADDDTTGIGTKAAATALTVLVYPDATATSFKLHDDDDAVTTLGQSLSGSAFTVTVSRALKDTLLRVRAETAPAGIKIDGGAVPTVADRAAFDAAAAGWFYEATTKSAWIKVAKGTSAHTVVSQ